MSSNDVERHLGSTLAALASAWMRLILPSCTASAQRGRCSTAVLMANFKCVGQPATGGVDFMLAPLGAPNEFGLDNRSKKWRFMLAVSDATDDLGTPPLRAGTDAVWAWRKALFDAHFEAARTALQRTE